MSSKENRARVGRSSPIEIASFAFKDVPSSFWGVSVLGVVACLAALVCAFSGAGMMAGGRQMAEIASASRLLLPSMDVGGSVVRDSVDRTAVAMGDIRRGFLVSALPAGNEVARAQEALAGYTTPAPGGRPAVEVVTGAMGAAGSALDVWSSYLMAGAVAAQVVALAAFVVAGGLIVRSFGHRYQVALLDFRRDEQYRKEFAQSLRIAFQARRAEAAGAGAFGEIAAHFNEGLATVLGDLADTVRASEGYREEVAGLKSLLDVAHAREVEVAREVAQLQERSKLARRSLESSMATEEAISHGVSVAGEAVNEAVVAESRSSMVATRLNDFVSEASRGIKRLAEDVEQLKKQIDLASSVAERVNFLSMNAGIVADRSHDAAGLREIAAEAGAVYERLKGHITAADSVAASYVSELRTVASDIGMALGASTENLSEVADAKSGMEAAISTLASVREMIAEASTSLRGADQALTVAGGER